MMTVSGSGLENPRFPENKINLSKSKIDILNSDLVWWIQKYLFKVKSWCGMWKF